jgi:hypothetical protein
MKSVRQRRGNNHANKKQPFVLVVVLVVARNLLSNHLGDAQTHDANDYDKNACAAPDNHDSLHLLRSPVARRPLSNWNSIAPLQA